jgi:hypothetical protein
VVPPSAHEPDGRVVIRHTWQEPQEPGSPRVLRLTVTPVVPVTEAALVAKLPEAASLAILSARIPGDGARAPLAGAWPAAGLRLGDLDAGETIELELEVRTLAGRGGMLAIALDGLSGAHPVHEGIGVAVGVPAQPPELRNGAAEFPAEPQDRTP